jgi:Asp-tRNA(Asn)/Glu-tRNA(Gln) amidotransferase A subunit family amidase
VVVERLVAAGAIVVGRTNQPEFCYQAMSANDLYGATANPWDLGRTPGCSSGGSAAAVAAGTVPLAVGSDGGGSIRIPASFCGVVGLKQSFGLVPRAPGWHGWYTLTHVGALAASVEDSALALQVLAGPDGDDPATLPAVGADYLAAARAGGDLRGLRVAASRDLGFAPVDEDVLALFDDAVERFRALGAEVVWEHPDLGSPLDTWNTIVFGDNVASEGPLLETGRVGRTVEKLVRLGEPIDAGTYAAARNEQAAYSARWHRFMRAYDLVLTPAMECTAFPLGQDKPTSIGGVELVGDYDDWCHFCYPFNLTGQPAISMPMGLAGGLPVGLQIVGGRWADELVLRAAAAWERAYPGDAAPDVPPAAGADPAALDALRAAVGSGAKTVELGSRGGLAAGSVVPGSMAAGSVVPGSTAAGSVVPGWAVGARVRRLFSPEDGRFVAELD